MLGAEVPRDPSAIRPRSLRRPTRKGRAHCKAAHWSHTEVSQSAASAAGRAPPVTYPKYRGPAVATTPASISRAIISTTSSGSDGESGNRPPSRAPSSSTCARGNTGRESSVSRNSAVRRRSSRSSVTARVYGASSTLPQRQGTGIRSVRALETDLEAGADAACVGGRQKSEDAEKKDRTTG